MGTKLQHTVDKLATKRRVFNNIQRSVNTIMLEHRHKESIKKTMLMHEDIFRQQVRELHRLYKVQRLLMDNHTKQRGTNICLELNNPSFVRRDPLKVGYGIKAQSVMDANPSSRDCTASCSAEAIRISKRFDHQRQSDGNMSEGVRANAEDQIVYIPNMPLMETNVEAVVDGSGEGSNGIEVELTLSIGPSTVMRRSESDKNHRSSGLTKKDQSQKERIDAGDEMAASSSPIFNQERKRPHWLFQDLN